MRSKPNFEAEEGVSQRLYPEIAFGGYSTRASGIAFYLRVRALLDGLTNAVVLDYGCGRGAHRKSMHGIVQDLHLLRGRKNYVIGIDVDPNASTNDGIDEFRRITSDKIPIESASIDICVSDWVLEHLEDIEPFFRECTRVIKAGGYLCFRTPNRLHYSSVAASLIPDRAHHALREQLGHPHDPEDVFPTYYRCNTIWKCRKMLVKHGFIPFVRICRGESQLGGLGYFPGLVGKWWEEFMPRILAHEIHGFGRKAIGSDRSVAEKSH